MRLEISGNFITKPWVLEDDRIVYGKNKKIFYLDSMSNIKYKPPTRFSDGGSIEFVHNGKADFLIFSNADAEKAKEAYLYMKEHSELDKIVEEVMNTETRMKCNVCGHIFCYTISDLKDNIKHAKRATISSVGAVANAIAGTQIGYYGASAEADRSIDRIVDYTKCPKCHSKDLHQITDEEFARLSSNETAKNESVSPADEILKYKGLLDMGIITQEEFEAKKKQLLGL